jgi:predicted MFS family arabinose efflux permease
MTVVHPGAGRALQQHIAPPPRSDKAPAPALRTWLAVLSLSLGAAMIVTTEFLPVGFLPDVAAGLHVSLGAAGLMVLIPGLGAAVAAPAGILLACGLDRRLIILVLSSLVALSNILAALAPAFAVMLIARLLLGIAIGGFWGVVPPLGFRLTGPDHGVRATSVILSGLSAGTVLGLPAGQLLGHLIGWRWTFAGAAVATALIAAAQAGLLPALPAVSRIHPADLAHVLAIPLARTGLTAGAVATIAQFAGSTYVTPLLLQHAHLGTSGATMVLLGYGLAGITGTLLGSRLVSRSRIGTFAAATAAFGAVLIAIPSLTGTPGIIAVLFLAWGALWGLVPLALQTLMLQSDPGSPEAASAMFITISQLGIAAGAALGAVLVDTAGLTTLFATSGTVAITAAVIAAVSRHGIGTVRP